MSKDRSYGNVSVYHGRTWTQPVNQNGGIVSISFDCRNLDRWCIALNRMEDGTKVAVSRAVNRALEKFKSVSVKETAKKYYVKQKDIRETLTLRKSTGGSMYGAMISRGKRKNLSSYAIRPTHPPVKPGAFRGAVMRRGGLKSIPLAFLLPHPSGPKAVIRDNENSKSYGGLRFLQSPSIPQIMKNFTTVIDAEREAKDVFAKRLDHEVMRLMGLRP